MLETENQQLESILKKAIQNMKPGDTHQIVSLTTKIEKKDPLQFFAAAEKISSTRIFWDNTIEDFTIVGIGSLKQIVAHDDRYKKTSEKWDAIQKKSHIHNPYGVPGTGLLALGGMSFDPQKSKTDLWKHFSDSQFHIPEITLTKHEQTYYLSMNTMITQNDSPEQLAGGLRRKVNYLLSYQEHKEQMDLKVTGKKEIEPEQWKEAVQCAIEDIRQQHTEKIVMARELRLQLSQTVDIPTVLKNLIQTQPNSYVFAFGHGEDYFVGATPERLVKTNKEHMLSMCLAGTAPRGETTVEDDQIKHNLFHDKKNREEHDFVVQMIRSGIEDYCTDIDIPETPSVHQLKNLQHLFTPVKAKLNRETTIFDIIEQLHPTPALGGTPTEKALAFIRDNELLDRGWYGAPVGWIDSNASGEFVVAIRSGLIQNDEASLFAGCGIVADSVIEEEYEETNVKFLPVLNVLQGKLN